jgi:nucleotide-binding universal stress UspA family protein
MPLSDRVDPTIMDRQDKILIAVDETDASLKAVGYIARMMGRRKDLHVRLFHVLPPIPPKLLEYGGTEDPQKEGELSAELHEAQVEWTARAKQSAQASLEATLKLLIDHGFLSENLSTDFSSSIHKPDVAREVLEAAGKWGCGTIVTGRHSLSWAQELFHRHVGEDLVHRAKGYAVLVVG